MFGWEYPPHVFGGLATANFGISQGLHAQGDVETVLCLPHPFGDEDRSACRIVAMNCVPIAWRDVNFDYVNLCRLQLYARQRPWLHGVRRRLPV